MGPRLWPGVLVIVAVSLPFWLLRFFVAQDGHTQLLITLAQVAVSAPVGWQWFRWRWRVFRREHPVEELVQDYAQRMREAAPWN